MEFYDPSEKARQSKVIERVTDYKYKEQFENVPIGKVFLISMNEIALSSLRPLASKVGKKLKRKFKIIEHADLGKFEILRLPDPVEPNANT